MISFAFGKTVFPCDVSIEGLTVKQKTQWEAVPIIPVADTDLWWEMDGGNT